MPTYEYECTKCGAVVDIFQPMTDPARKKLRKTDPKPCDCDAAVRRRIGTGAGIIFKGSGFYTTDYRSESYKEAAKADKKAGESKAKSKPEDASKPKKSDSTEPTPKTDGGTKNKPESKAATV